ncbi:MAG: proline dehydrogenase family protein [Nitrososphaera sp.]|nr:proline dehydrogenase family protein [Nitrososphaera sp.]
MKALAIVCTIKFIKRKRHDSLLEKSDHSHSYDSSLLERLLYRVAKKWVAGYSKEEAIAAAIDANGRGMSAIINFLGEEATDAKAVDGAVGEYLSLMDLLKEKKVRGCVSAKPTQLGLAIGYDLCLKNFKTLAARASAHGQFVWMDMESIKFAEDTISIYLELFKDYKMAGLAIQSYLRRSASDLLHIIEQGGKVRLVKGAYHEPEEHAFSTSEEVGASFSRLMKMLFDGGSFFAIATHDSKLIDDAISLSRGSDFEFQLLMGIRDELKRDLVGKGFAVAEYIPYGSNWLPYSVRRIRERKRNLILLARSLVQS